MSYKQEDYRTQMIDRAVSKLTDSGVVPLDEIYALTVQGVDFSTLDDKYNITN